MAIRTKENTRSEGKVPPLPRDRYTCRALKATYGRSKESQNKMITLECEIAEPTELSINGTVYALDSFRFRYYLILEEDGGHLGKVVEFLEKLELEPVDDELIDTDKEYCNTYLKQFDKLAFDAVLTSKDKIAVKRNPDLKAKDKFIPILDTTTNKPMVQGHEVVAQITDVLCRAEVGESNKPY